MALITLENVTIAFEGVPAVENVNFRVERGEYLVVIGENGSGKSTLIRAMLGLVHPSKGYVRYGEGLRRTQIGYLPQQTAAQRDFPASVEEVVLSGCLGRADGFHFFYNRSHYAKAHEKMKMLDILPLKDKPYRTLSGGQQQRTLLARALCATDLLLLLDEPVTGLDPASTEDLYAMVHRLNRERGVTIVMVSHDLKGALANADKVLEVDRGVGFFGTAAEYAQHTREGIHHE